MNCMKCGHELNSNQKFCSNCGAEQGVAATAPNQPNALSQRKAPEEYNFRTDKGAMGTINMVLGILLIVVSLLFILLWGLVFLVLFFLAGERDIVGTVQHMKGSPLWKVRTGRISPIPILQTCIL